MNKYLILLSVFLLLTTQPIYAANDQGSSLGPNDYSYDGHYQPPDPDDSDQMEYDRTHYSTGRNFNVTSDDNGVTIHMYDKAKTSNVWYSTIGMSLTRCKFNPALPELANGNSSDYITTYIVFDTGNVEKHEHPTDAIGWTKTDYFISWSVIKQYIANKGYSEWLQELNLALNHEAEMWFRFDSIMIVIDHYAWDGKVYLNHPPFDGTNPNAIIHAKGWSNPNGLKSHYNQYLKLGAAQPADEGVDKDQLVRDDVSSAAQFGVFEGGGDYAGANANEQGYDATRGIPTMREITAYAEALPWYGFVRIWARMCEKYLEPKYIYTWTEPYPGHHTTIPSPQDMWNRSPAKAFFEKHSDVWTCTVTYDTHEKDVLGDDGQPTGEKVPDYYYNVEGHFTLTRSFDDYDGSTWYHGVKIFAAFQYVDRSYLCNSVYDFASLKMYNDAYAEDEVVDGEKHVLQFSSGEATLVDIREAGTDTISPTSGRVKSSKYIKFPTSESLSKSFGYCLDKMYVDDYILVEKDAYNQTESKNDLFYIKNAWDKYGDTGCAYLGNRSGTAAHGCNFRVDKLGGSSIDDSIKANRGDNGLEGKSLYWEKCTNSAAGPEHKGSPADPNNGTHSYTTSDHKLDEGNKKWEILDDHTTTIPKTAYNGKHATTIKDVIYVHANTQIANPIGETKTGGEEVLDGHLYSDDYSSGAHRGGYHTQNEGKTTGSKWTDTP